jgi:hypothetical protein
VVWLSCCLLSTDPNDSRGKSLSSQDLQMSSVERALGARNGGHS